MTSPCSNSGEASAALSHIRASIEPVRSVSTNARYLPPSFLSRSDLVVATKNPVIDWSSNLARSAIKISFIFAGTLQHRRAPKHLYSETVKFVRQKRGTQILRARSGRAYRY